MIRAFRGLFALSRAFSLMSTIIQEIERSQLREVPRFKAGDTVRVHFKVIEGTRQRDPGLRGDRDQASGRRRARDVHRPQELLRRRRRAHVPAALAEDRQDRGHGDRRRQPREAVLPPRQGRQEGSCPRAPPATNTRACSRPLGERPPPCGYPRASGFLAEPLPTASDRDASFSRSTAGSVCASSRAPTRRGAARWRGRSSWRACCSTSSGCATIAFVRSPS